jgi:hypothetical protein
MCVHPSGLLIATGDTASNIHIWSSQSMHCVSIIQGLVKEGLQNIHFSPGKYKHISMHL